MRRLCDEHGALYISDEVICGLGGWVTGSAAGVRHRARHVTSAKAVTSGYVPLGGVIVGGKALGMLETNSAWKLLTASPTRAITLPAQPPGLYRGDRRGRPARPGGAR